MKLIIAIVFFVSVVLLAALMCFGYDRQLKKNELQSRSLVYHLKPLLPKIRKINSKIQGMGRSTIDRKTQRMERTARNKNGARVKQFLFKSLRCNKIIRRNK